MRFAAGKAGFAESPKKQKAALPPLDRPGSCGRTTRMSSIGAP
jgi:hypothetical protein